MNMYLSNDFRLNVLLLPPSRNVRVMWVLLDISEKLTPIEVEVVVVAAAAAAVAVAVAVVRIIFFL